MMDRRRFLTELGAVAGASALTAPALAAELNAEAGRNAAGVPLRTLGRTGAKVTILGLGTAPVGHSMPGAKLGVPVYEAALEAGINLVDTARAYDDAESYLGELVPRWREKVFLVTKSMPRGNTPTEAVQAMRQQFEQSLRLLKTDHVDLLHIHNVGGQPPELIMAPEGPLDFARRMKERGQARFIGITGHSHASRFADIINTGSIDAIMVVLNFADGHAYPFEERVLPAARKQQCGILAMKVYGGHSGGFAGYRRAGPAKFPADLLESSFSYSLGIEGVAAAVIGPYTAEQVRQNVGWAKRYSPLTAERRRELREQGRGLAAGWGLRFGTAI